MSSQAASRSGNRPVPSAVDSPGKADDLTARSNHAKPTSEQAANTTTQFQ